MLMMPPPPPFLFAAYSTHRMPRFLQHGHQHCLFNFSSRSTEPHDFAACAYVIIYVTTLI
jgi:hypothetical protein